MYVRAFDPTGGLWALRTRVARAVGLLPPLPLRLLGFVNLLRYRHPRVERLLAAVDARPTVPASFSPDRVQVVRTDKVLSAAGTDVLADVRLRSANPRP